MKAEQLWPGPPLAAAASLPGARAAPGGAGRQVEARRAAARALQPALPIGRPVGEATVRGRRQLIVAFGEWAAAQHGLDLTGLLGADPLDVCCRNDVLCD